MTVPVLIVDDSPIMRAMLKKALDLSGHSPDTVCEACDGIEALERLAEGHVEIVFADIHMPRMTGLELIEKMARDPRYKSVAVVVVSSDATEKHQEQLVKCGVRAILRKPFRPEQIRAVIRSLAKDRKVESES
jgi:two-component system, chemotaxis family, chemotaxis protein CheY